jgi:hypothetical protein
MAPPLLHRPAQRPHAPVTRRATPQLPWLQARAILGPTLATTTACTGPRGLGPPLWQWVWDVTGFPSEFFLV